MSATFDGTGDLDAVFGGGLYRRNNFERSDDG